MGARSPGWLLLDSAAFSLDGSECNLVGSSFPAFNSEARPCTGRVGDCLRNQLLDLAEVTTSARWDSAALEGVCVNNRIRAPVLLWFRRTLPGYLRVATPSMA